MNYDQLKDTLMAKLEQEFSEYKQYLIKNFAPEEIIEKSYEINFKEQVVSVLEGYAIDKNEIKALLNTDKALDKMYKKYINVETTMLDTMRDIVTDILGDIGKEYIKKIEKAR